MIDEILISKGTIANDVIVNKAMDIFYKRHPSYHEKYGEAGRQRTYEDWHFHLSYLNSAIQSQIPNLFVDYLAWCKLFFYSINFPEKYILESFEILRDIFQDYPDETSQQAFEYLNLGINQFPNLPTEINSFIHEDSKLGVIAQQYLNSLLRRDRIPAFDLIFDAVKNNIYIKDIYLKIFQPVQLEVGRLWQMNQISVAMEHYCTASTQLVMSRLYPYLFTGEKGEKKLVATSVSGELHELGIRMVSDIFEMEGWDTYYLGANTPHNSIISTLEEVGADVLAISATIPFHIDQVSDLIKGVRKNPQTANIKILVGGYPFNQNADLWKVIGADGYASNAENAVETAKSFYESM